MNTILVYYNITFLFQAVYYNYLDIYNFFNQYFFVVRLET